ncbi:hypothetical protein C2E23DRAFT_185472 [Lenzites betulinus]|nr:hypothetical protein C2E23DRAFT_185472 [Lenzites betulinus]
MSPCPGKIIPCSAGMPPLTSLPPAAASHTSSRRAPQPSANSSGLLLPALSPPSPRNGASWAASTALITSGRPIQRDGIRGSRPQPSVPHFASSCLSPRPRRRPIQSSRPSHPRATVLLSLSLQAPGSRWRPGEVTDSGRSPPQPRTPCEAAPLATKIDVRVSRRSAWGVEFERARDHLLHSVEPIYPGRRSGRRSPLRALPSESVCVPAEPCPDPRRTSGGAARHASRHAGGWRVP